MTSIICYNSKIFINERKDECKDGSLWAACEGGERSAGSSAEHDVVHDLREVPPSVRHPDLVRVARQYWPEVNIIIVLITPQVKSSWQNAIHQYRRDNFTVILIHPIFTSSRSCPLWRRSGGEADWGRGPTWRAAWEVAGTGTTQSCWSCRYPRR